MGRRYIDDDSRERVVIVHKAGCLGGCMRLFLIAGLVAVAGVVLLAVAMKPAVTAARKAADEAEAAKPATPPAPPAPSLMAGDEAEIWLPGGKGSWLADEQSYDAMLEAENAKDAEELSILMAKGKVIREENGTRVKVLKVGVLSVLARVRNGSNPGFEGWIQRGFVRPVAPVNGP